MAWIFSDRPGWSGLRHLTLGFDTGSLASESPLRPLLQAYAAAVGRLPGAVPARAEAIRGYSFTPAAVLAAKDQLAGLLRGLVQRVHRHRGVGGQDERTDADVVPYAIRAYIAGRVADPSRRRLVEGFVRGVLELGDAEAQLGRSEKTPDGLSDYLMLRYRGVRRYGAAVYVTPRTGRIDFRLPAGAAAGRRHASVSGYASADQVVAYLTSEAAQDEAVELAAEALLAAAL